MNEYKVQFENITTLFAVSFNEEIPIGPVVNHAQLINRDAPDQHPISAITGLTEELELLKEHINNVDIHVTTNEKETWNNKSRVYRNASGALVIR